MNYTRAAREPNRRKTTTVAGAVDFNLSIPAFTDGADAQRAADELAEQAAGIQRAADRAARFPASLPDLDKLAQISQAADRAAKFMVRFIPPA
jgi:hypothetical protein